MRTCNYDCANCIDEKLRSWSTDWKAACKKQRKFNASHEVKQRMIVDSVTGESIFAYICCAKVNKKLLPKIQVFGIICLVA